MTVRLVDTPVLETERLTLRAQRPSDYPAWKAFYESDRARFVGGGPDAETGKASRAFLIFMGHWAFHGFGLFVVEERESGRPVGQVGPYFPEHWPERELGWTLWDRQVEGQGIAAEAAIRVRDHLFHDLGWPTLVSYIHPDNARSIALAERLGAVRDTSAAGPDPSDLVYRHPAPKVAA